jgi:hypothetical protein
MLQKPGRDWPIRREKKAKRKNGKMLAQAVAGGKKTKGIETSYDIVQSGGQKKEQTQKSKGN